MRDLPSVRSLPPFLCFLNLLLVDVVLRHYTDLILSLVAVGLVRCRFLEGYWLLKLLATLNFAGDFLNILFEIIHHFRDVLEILGGSRGS